MTSGTPLPRELLYEEVWAEPMTTIAARYGVSSSYLARVCERLNVPRPPRGYWAKLEVGKAPTKPALPDARPGDELTWSRDGVSPRIRSALPRPPAAEQPTAEEAPRRTPRRLKEHPLLRGARTHFEGVLLSEEGYLRPTKRRLVDLFVSPATLDRALKVANRLFLALEASGHQVTFAPTDQQLGRPGLDESGKRGRERYEYGRWRPDRPTVVYFGTVAIGLTLFEMSEEVQVWYVDGKYLRRKEVPLSETHRLLAPQTWSSKRDLPNGRLCLRASSPYAGADWEQRWCEAKRRELQAMIPEIVRELNTAAVTISGLVEEAERRAEVQRREWELQHEKWQREEAERRRLQNIKESREQLAAIISAWGTAIQIEGFFADAEERAGRLNDQERAALLDRLRRARELVGGVDALQRFLMWKSPDER